MNLGLSDYRLIFVVVTLIGILLIASPVLAEYVHLKNNVPFSEVYLLGSDQNPPSSPLNVVSNQENTLQAGVGNHLETSTYYALVFKLRNENEPLPSKSSETPSDLPQIFEVKHVIEAGQSWETKVTLLFSDISFSNNHCVLGKIIINNQEIQINKIAQFNEKDNGFYYQLFVELWAYNPNSRVFEYQNNFVSLWLNASV
jgi:hypothetical protein